MSDPFLKELKARTKRGEIEEMLMTPQSTKPPRVLHIPKEYEEDTKELRETEYANLNYIQYVEKSHADQLQAELDEAKITIKELESSRLPDYLHELVRNRNLVLEKRLEKAEALLREAISEECWGNDFIHRCEKYFAEVESE